MKRIVLVLVLVICVAVLFSCSSKKKSSSRPSTGTGTGTGTDTGTVDIPKYEQDVLDIVNQERASGGLGALQWDDATAAVARAYSETMRDTNHFDHTGLDGSTMTTRLSAGGVTYSAAGENIARGQTTPSAVMTAWMNSDGHRANIMNGQFTHIGVGLAMPGYWWTQNFIRK